MGNDECVRTWVSVVPGGSEARLCDMYSSTVMSKTSCHSLSIRPRVGTNGHPARARGRFPIRPRPRADTSEPPVGWMLALLLTRWQGQGSPETMAMLSTGARGYACSRGQHRHGFRSNDKKTQALVGKYLNNSIGQSLRISYFGQ